jgi:hypothetical protein
VELPENGKEPGSVLAWEDELMALGTGLPSLLPVPEKGTLRFGGGSYISFVRRATRSSTGWCMRTFNTDGGALLHRKKQAEEK